MLAIALVVALGVVGTVRANVGGVADRAVDGLVACLLNNPDHAVCKTLVKALNTLLPEDEDVLGGTVTRAQLSEISVFGSLGLSDPDNKSLVVSSACRSVDFPNSTSSPAVFVNRSQSDLIIDFADLHILKAPSATIVIAAGTSSISSVRFNELQNGESSLQSLTELYNQLVIGTSSFEDTHITNLRRASSTQSDIATGLTSSTRDVLSCISGSCSVGTSLDRNIVLQPNEYLVLHLESTDKRWAVTTTVSTSTPSTDPQDVRRRTEGDIGLRARQTVCWRTVATTTPQ